LAPAFSATAVTGATSSLVPGFSGAGVVFFWDLSARNFDRNLLLISTLTNMEDLPQSNPLIYYSNNFIDVVDSPGTDISPQAFLHHNFYTTGI
jgi:hypothetical protein